MISSLQRVLPADLNMVRDAVVELLVRDKWNGSFKLKCRRYMKNLFLFSLILLLIVSCSYTSQCERYYFPKNFIGNASVFFDQKNREPKVDKSGCIVYEFSEKGECFTASSYKSSVGVPDVTFRYFEKISEDSLVEIFLFRESRYLQDTAENKFKKYVFIKGAGYINSVITLDMNIDFGCNYGKHTYVY